ncbi:8211_t:CDS:1, partial [Gigaspora rosea]
NYFEHAIQVYVPLDLLTTGYFTGNYNNGYNRIALNDIAGLIGGDAANAGAYNVLFMKNLVHKLAISCFDYERYILYETHKNDLTSYFCNDFNRGARRKRHYWESVEDNPTTILLDKTNFPEEMNIHFAAANDRGIGQGNLICQNADGRSRQVPFRLWFDKVFITPKMIKEKQK